MRFATLCLAALFVLSVLPTGQAEEKIRQGMAPSSSDEPKADKNWKAPNRQLQRRIYKVGDLIACLNPPNENGEKSNVGPNAAKQYVPLIIYLQTNVAPVTWKCLGGDGTIAAYVPGGAIVISQVGEVHDQIMQELKTLREAYGILDEFERLNAASIERVLGQRTSDVRASPIGAAQLLPGDDRQF